MAGLSAEGASRAHGALRELGRDRAGAVYVEFLIAIIPVLTLFLAICQFALIGVAELVVHHAALRAVRTAIVTLEDDDPQRFGEVGRGVLSGGDSDAIAAEPLLMTLLGVAPDAALFSAFSASAEGERSQQGSRMQPIRTAAYVPMLLLAPNVRADDAQHSLGRALSDPLLRRLAFALDYTRSAAAVTVMAGEGSDSLAAEPIARNADVTVRVTYLFSCGVPLIRVLLCDTEAAVTLEPSTESAAGRAELLGLRENPDGFSALGLDGARVYVISAEATLPNQGAVYVAGGGTS
jgi:hypothetical protein